MHHFGIKVLVLFVYCYSISIDMNALRAKIMPQEKKLLLHNMLTINTLI